MKNAFVFKWDPEYLSIHVDSMDRDHQKMIEMMNQIYILHSRNGRRDQILQALQRLGAFVVEHFQREESFFDGLKGYGDAEIHKAIHQKLLKKFTYFVKQFEMGQGLTHDFFFFLKAWLVAHIEGVDAKYGLVAHPLSISRAS